MKKNLILFSTTIIALCLTAFGFISWSESGATLGAAPEFIYDINYRSGTTITKEKLHNAKSVSDILPREADWTKHPVQRVIVSLFQDGSETTEIGDNLALNKEQTQLLRSIDYSKSFRLVATCQDQHKAVPDRELAYNLTYFITVIPEKEAEYKGGEDALIAYLKKKSKKETAIVKEDQLRQGQISFTVTKKGTIAKVELSSTSGYPSIDKAMVELITTLPRKWDPATNAKGEKVEQEFIFSFGRRGGGC